MIPDELEAVLASLEGLYDGEEAVDELTHALQCAEQAHRSGADRELVAAALLHDIGRSPLLAPDEAPHEVIAERWLLGRFGARVAWVAGAHVLAKLYLLDCEPGYGGHLSVTSRRSAELQGSPRLAVPTSHRWWADAVQLRRWDDAAKDPAAPLPDRDELLSIVTRASGVQ